MNTLAMSQDVNYENHCYWYRRMCENQLFSVYFIKNLSSGHIKIGWSSNPEHRVKELQAGAEGKLVILTTQPGGVSAESSIHRHFKDLHFYGEWYVLDSSLERYISDVLKKKYVFFDKNGRYFNTKLAEYYANLKVEAPHSSDQITLGQYMGLDSRRIRGFA